MVTSKESRILNSYPNIFRAGNNVLITGLLKAVAQEDDAICLQYDEARSQLFVNYASSKFLNALGSNVGVTRPTIYPSSDANYRDIIPTLSYVPKNIKKTIYDLFDAYWGTEYTRSTVTARHPAPYSLSDGDQLRIKVDSDASLQTRIIPDLSSYTVAAGSKIVKQGATPVSINFTDNGIYRGQFKIAAAGLGTLEVGQKITIDKAVSDPMDGYIRSIVLSGVEYEIIIEVISDPKEYIITFNAVDFDDMLFCTLDEIIAVITACELPITASTYRAYNGKEYLRIQTRTTGGGGSIEITDQPSLSGVDIMNFYEGKIQNVRCAVYEINPNELVVKIPDSIPIDCGLKGANHFHPDSSIYATYPPTETDPYWPSSYIFDTPSSTCDYTVQSIRTTIAQTLDAGQVYSQISVVDSSEFPATGGYLVFDFGNDEVEALVPYNRRLSSPYLYLDASYSFVKNHAVGASVNLVTYGHFVPASDGTDYGFFLNNTHVAEELMTELLDLVKAAGVILRFEVGGLTVSVNEFGPTLDLGWFGDACMTTAERNDMVAGIYDDPLAPVPWGAAQAGRVWFNSTTNNWEGWTGTAIAIRG